MSQPSSVNHRFQPDDLKRFARAVLATTGASGIKTNAIADILMEGELLGYKTHGLKRLAYNVQLLKDATDEPVDFDCGTRDIPVFSWDASFNPGPWVLTRALDHGADMASHFGISLGVIKRSGHIACAAAYMPKMLKRGLITLIMASTPNERVICPPAGATPITSSTPMAFAAPGTIAPLLFDFTLGAITLGALEQAAHDGRRLADRVLRQADGTLTNDPSKIKAIPPASILPFGGPFGMHKGFSLALMVEVMTAGLTGLLPDDAKDDGEANCISIIVIDPRKFVGIATVQRVVDMLRDSLRQDAKHGARIPGERAWRARENAHEYGLELTKQTNNILLALSKKTGVLFPEVLASRV